MATATPATKSATSQTASASPKKSRKATSQVDLKNQQGAIEDLFNDFYRSRRKVYWMNFSRGIFFGIGSVIGGTVVIALIAWFLGLFADIPGGFGDFIRYIVNLVNASQT